MARRRHSKWTLGLCALALAGLTGCRSGTPGRVQGAGPMGPNTPSYSIAQAPANRPAPAPQAGGPAPTAPVAPTMTAPAAGPDRQPLAPPAVSGAPAPARTPPPAASGATTPATKPGGGDFQFQFAVGDELEVSVWNEKELTTTHRVMRDGTIPAKAVGNVKVVGRTLDDVHTELTERYADFLNDPRVSIRVLSIWADRVFVVGEVAKPAAIAMPASMTVMEAITQAGGFNPGISDLKTIRVIRKTTAGRPQIITMNADAMLAGRRQMAQLKPGDLVFVHATGLADWSRTLNQLLSPIGAIVGNAANVITAVAVID